MDGVAIIGMAGRFPGAADLEQFWVNLAQDTESVSFFSDDDLAESGIDAATLPTNYVRARAILESPEWFDNTLFGFTPREAQILDPQQRVFLEIAWQALERAGYDPEQYTGSIGVFAGMANNTYHLANLQAEKKALDIAGAFPAMISNEKDYLATRTSYKLGLTGPSININTACSTSLVAIAQACASLLSYQCDTALSGGVAIRFPQKKGTLYQEGGMTSADGHCRAFDANATGMVSGEGAGVVILKRLAEAVEHGDNILAVIRGFAVNNDGSHKVGYTAPAIDGQAEVIAQAQALAGVDPGTISYVEAHGTATPLGDPIEIAALTKAFRMGTAKRGYCAIGSVKTNIGHLDAAAGVAGLIKTVLAMAHEQIPASLHFKSPNPGIDFENSPFFVNAELAKWPRGAAPRRAGVSSFGIGGTNAHLVVEEAPALSSFVGTRRPELLPLSAKSPAALDQLAANFAAWLRDHPETDLASISYTLQMGRRALPHRRIVVCRDVAEAANLIEQNFPEGVPTPIGADDEPRVATLREMGQRFLSEAKVDWRTLWPDRHPRRIVLPTYPFQRERFWVDPGCARIETTNNAAAPSPSSVSTLEELRTLFHELSGLPKEKIGDTVSFSELGFDSLLLTQASMTVESSFGVSIAMRQLQEQLSNLERLAAYVSERRMSSAAKAPQLEQSGDHGPFRPPALVEDAASEDAAGVEERSHVAALIERYVERTVRSKAMAAVQRAHFADPRAVAGFRPAWKEMVYPIVVERSSGSKLWDVDGNEYIDLLMGFGVNLFGHSPDFVRRAVEEQLRKGIEIGPQSPLAGSVAERICAMTGNQRATFCNTGSESVLVALRLARMVTNRKKIVLFSGSYHGVFDEVLVRKPSPGQIQPIPVAPGIPPEMAANVVVLEYGNEESLEFIRRNPDQFAAVLVEPVQSRNPNLQPVNFLHALRKLTEDAGIALIFDEVLSGFRCHPGGVQALFDVRADITTYGKIVGGGMPLGIVAGTSRFMDALDGGAWRYGDDSSPQQRVTYFAGTFVRHPLAMTAASAVLDYFSEHGPELQRVLNDRTSILAQELRIAVSKSGLPLNVAHFSFQLFLRPGERNKMASLLFYHLRARGIHILEGRPAFLSTAHSENDVERVLDAFQASLNELPGTHRRPILDTPLTPPAFLSAPLTPSQTDLWISTQMSPDASCSYNLTYVLRMRGPLHAGELASALQTLADRHESLRSTFHPDGTEQRIWTKLSIDLQQEDYSPYGLEEAEKRLDAIADREGRTPFDLERGPLVRAILVALDHEVHALLLTAHHLVVDGYSFAVLLDELGKIYSARLTGGKPQLQEALSNRVYEQRRGNERPGLEAEEIDNYWLDQLADPPEPLDLPTDRTRPAVKTYAADTVRLRFDEKTVAQWREASARFGTSLFAYLLTGFSVLLHRLSGSGDFVIGIPSAGQLTPEGLRAKGNRSLVGDFVNLLPVRIRCEGKRRFAEQLDIVRRQVLDGYEHQNFTFGDLVRKLKLPRDPSRTPLVGVVFNLDREALAESFAGLAVEVLGAAKAFDFFDLRLNVTASGARPYAALTFNTDLFDSTTARRWLEHWRTLLNAAGAGDDTVASLPILDAAQRDRILRDHNQTARTIPEGCVHDRFDRQAEKTPDAIAVEDDAGRLTYRELRHRADRLARRLRSAGASSDVPVAIYMERSLEILVGLLAILKSGAPYVPLDPAYPEARLRLMLEHSGARIVLRNAIADQGLSFPGMEVQEVDSNAADISGIALTRPKPDDLAYILYTSGSSGAPKGVGVSHGALANLIAAMQEEISLTERDVLMAVSPLTFDIATLEFLLPVVSGARVVVASGDTASDGRVLLDALRARGATVMQATPASWRMLLDAGWDGRPALKVLCGGDALPPRLAEELVETGNPVWNLYGPTETTIWATAHRLTRGESTRKSVPIGKPLANMQAYVLDQDFRPVPTGVTGEIFLGLARGYIGQEDLTRERFPSVALDENLMRLYRTGDFGRIRDDGLLECSGRQDSQIKLRGFRIELNEISSALSQHPDIASATAIVHRNETGGGIFAYLVAKPNCTPAIEELRDWVAESPTLLHSAESAFIQMDALPLTPHGKIDVRGLPKIASSSEAPFLSSCGGTEFRLLKLWEEVLGPEVFDATRQVTNRSFFELGADSLLAARFLSKIEHTFGVRFTMRELFEAPTIQRLADRLREPNADPCPWTLFQPNGSNTPLFFAGAYSIHLPLVEALGSDRPFIGLLSDEFQLPKKLTVEELARPLLESIRSFKPAGPVILAGWSAFGVIAFEVAQQLRRAGQEVELLVLLDVTNPVSLRSRNGVVLDKIRFHLGEVQKLAGAERPRYLEERGANMLRGAQRKVNELGATWATRRGISPEVSQSLSWNQRLALMIKMVRHYEPAPYDSPVLLVRTPPHNDSLRGWDGVLSNVRVVQVGGNHQTMFKEPYVSVIASEIRSGLGQTH